MLIYCTPVCVCVAGQAQLIDLLVCKGAPVNATDYHALTPLHLACQRGYQGVTVNTHTHTHTHTLCLSLLCCRADRPEAAEQSL